MTKSKLISLLVSFAIACGLWLFVVTNVSMEDDRTYYNVPVVLEGESILTDRNLILTDISNNTVSLHLSGTRSDLNLISSSGMSVRVDLSKIDEPGENIAVNYTPVYPSDVTSSSVAVEKRSPDTLYVSVDYRRTKELPVVVKYTGTRSEDYLYDTENAVLDNTTVTAVGPAAAVDQMDHAEISIDLTGQTESISQSYRYTLCDENSSPVDAHDVTTNVEEVRVEVPIRRLTELTLGVNLTYGGGATESNTTVTVEPQTIQVSGGEAALAELGDTLTLGTVNLAELDKSSNEMSYPITLPDGITNQTGVSEAKVTIAFTGLATKEFTVNTFREVNLAEGLEAEIISASLSVKVRGPISLLAALDADDLVAEVDLANAEVGTATYRAQIILPDNYSQAGALGSYTVSARVQAASAD